MASQEFTEEQVKQIIPRAAELQSEGQPSNSSSGQATLSLDELEQIGNEVGFGAELIRQAAAEVGQPVVKESSSSDTHIYVKRIIDGKLEGSAWREMVTELRHRFGSSLGKTTEDAQRMEWTFVSVSGIETKATLNNRGTQSELKLSQRVGLGSTLTESIGYGFITTLILATVLITLFDNELGLFGKSSAFIGTFLLLTTLVYGLDHAWRNRKHRQLNELGDDLAEIIRQSQKVSEKEQTRFSIDAQEQSPNRKKMDNLLDEIEYNEEDSVSSPSHKKRAKN